MGQIKVLPENLINQIAAGEVVERPASVIKELVENSIDAGARRLIIEVEGGGDSYIRITDDGCGMESDDALLSFERHSTSKISTQDDLDNINTLGFRGEAIASIASVSLFTLQTKKKGSLEGTLIKSEGGKIIKNKRLGCPEGTQIEVEQLFFNTPARKKYLKNEATEYGHILDVITGMALAYPEIAFKFVHNKKAVFNLPSTEDHLSRIRALLGRDISKELIPVFYGHSKIHLTGFTGKPAIARSNRKGQYLFINRRQITSHVLSYAVKQSYHSLLPKEKIPVFILFITMSPELLDVNVHPRKMEVRFSNEKEIFGIFIKACKSALEKNVLAPSLVLDNPVANVREHASLNQKYQSKADYSNMKLEDKAAVNLNDVFNVNIKEAVPSQQFSAILNEECDRKTESGIAPGEKFESARQQASDNYYSLERKDEDGLIPLVQLNNSYLLCRQGESLTIIDQHAAHERIRYEEIIAEFESRKILKQQLLTPEQLELSLQEAALLNENSELLSQMGFEIEPFGGNTFSVFSVPGYLVNENIREVILGIIDDINNNSIKGDFQSRKERALTYAACRSAVKFGDPLSDEEQKYLCKRLLEMKLPYTCPHGRPTMIKMSFQELEKRFGRI